MDAKLKTRVRYIDALRGFTMILVVFGHVLTTSFDLGGYRSVLGSFLLTFRMPMFFFISGYIAYRGIEFWTPQAYGRMLKKKAVVQIVPALIFFTLFSISRDSSPLGVLSGGGWGGYWFTFVLFEMFCLYFTFSLISRYTHHRITDMCMILCSLLGIVWLAVASRVGVVYEVLCFENVAKYLQFFTFGLLCRKYHHVFVGILGNDYVRAIIITSFVICFIFCYDDELKVAYPLIYSLIHDELVRYAGLLTVFLFFFQRKDYFDQSRHVSSLLTFIGRRTLDIYLLHYFFLPSIPQLTTFLQPSNMLLIQLFLSLLISMLVIGLCLLVSEIIRSSHFLAYYCFGVKYR